MSASVKAGYSTPMFHVASIEESIRFYRLLGFELIDTDGCKPIGWARMHCEGGALMFLRSEELVSASAQGVLLYMYTPNLAALRDHLLASGADVSPITHPPYMPSGEIHLTDPDGYVVMVGHWSDKEHEQWERERHKRIGK